MDLRQRTYFFTAVIMIVVVVAFTAFLVAAVHEWDEATVNTDPREGRVYMEHTGWKFCDGTTLIYSGGLDGVVANSPECAP